MKRLLASLVMTTVMAVLVYSGSNTTTAQDAPTLLLQARLSQGTWYAQWSPDSQKIAVYRRSLGALQILEVRSGRALYQFPEDIDIQAVVWSPDSTRLFVGVADGRVLDGHVYVIDSVSGQTLFELSHPGSIYGIRVSADGQHVLVFGEFGAAKVWNVNDGTLAFELTPREQIVRAEWDETQQKIMTYSNDGALSVWNIGTGEYLFSIWHNFAINGSTWKSDGTQIITYGQDRTARITDIGTGATLLTLTHQNFVNAAYWLAGETQIMTETADNLLQIWALNGALLQRLPYHDTVLLSNPTQALSQNEKTLQIWDVETGEEVMAFVHDNLVQSYSVNSDESLLLSWTIDGDGRIWNVQTGAEQFRFGDLVRTGAWSPDGSMVLVITDENRLQVWAMP